MLRLLPIFLAFTFFISPFSVFAEERPIPNPTEAPFQNIPIYFYISESNEVLGIAPIAQDFAIGCSLKILASTEAENLQETPQIPECFLWDLNSGSIIPLPEFGAGEGQRIFTGHEYDASTGLSYMGARYQNPVQGKFLSQDPIFQNSPEYSLEDPQGLNSYSYARNNPILLVDPDGKQFVLPRQNLPWLNRSLTLSQQYADRLFQSIIPIHGDILDLSEGIHGRDVFTGESLSTGEKITSRVLTLVPFISGRLVREGSDEVSRLFVRTLNEIKINRILQAARRGDTSVTVGSLNDIDAAGRRFVGEGARPIYDRSTGDPTGYLSADETKRYRFYDTTKEYPSANLEFLKEGRSTSNTHLKLPE